MKLLIEQDDFTKLKPETRADLVATLLAGAAPPLPAAVPGIDWDGVVDLSETEVEEFMARTHARTRAGLRVFAEHGPVIAANQLGLAGITNYGHFQGRVTQRTRTIKKTRKKVWLFGWDDWAVGDNAKRGYGHYGVTQTTYASLRKFFKLP
jgi:hypothetical protein